VITRLRLQHFKGFRDFAITFGDDALLVGPNNAGKSTIIGALRLCGSATRVAMRTKASEAFQDQGNWISGHPLHLATRAGFVSENIRHEFDESETRLDLTYSTKAMLHIVWPAEAEEASPFFWVEYPKGMQVRTASKAKTSLTGIGIVPTLTPVEHSEKQLKPDHISSNYETKLASRHFRNQLALERDTDPDGFKALIDYLVAHTPELANLRLGDSYSMGDRWLDLYYLETGGRTEKEIFWAGDGIQICSKCCSTCGEIETYLP
jgi:AAA domain